MKTKLTSEQSQRLIELGVDPSKASDFEYLDPYGLADTIPTGVPIFTLTDILSLLPKERNGYYLSMVAAMVDLESMAIGDGWMVSYISDEMKAESQDSIFQSSELIDALYELLCRVLKKTPRQKQTTMKGLTINKVKIGDKVRNLKTGNIGVIRNNIAPFIHHYDWVEVQIEKSLNGKTFVACWSLKNLELVKPENTDGL